MTGPDDLRTLTLFAECSTSELARAARLLTTVDASPGRILMVQGGTAKQFVIVESGEVQVIHHRFGGPDHVVNLRADSWVGEMGLLDNVPCTATVRTRDGARVHVAGVAEFRALLEIAPVARRLRMSADEREVENRLADALS